MRVIPGELSQDRQHVGSFPGRTLGAGGPGIFERTIVELALVQGDARLMAAALNIVARAADSGQATRGDGEAAPSTAGTGLVRPPSPTSSAGAPTASPEESAEGTAGSPSPVDVPALRPRVPGCLECGDEDSLLVGGRCRPCGDRKWGEAR